MNQYLAAFKKFADFKTRSSKSEFWTFILVNIAINFVLGMIGELIHFPYLSVLSRLWYLYPRLRSAHAVCMTLAKVVGFI